jgi:hypothetical protein
MGPAARRQAARGQRERESDAAVKAGIAHDFPGWQPWKSSAGRWWAVRQGPAWAPPGAPVEWARTVHGDDAEQLRAALAAQEMLGGAGR